MLSWNSSPFPFSNQILRRLPKPEYELLSTSLELVRLPSGKILYEAGEAIKYTYFLMSGMVSLLSVTQEGRAVEVGMIGNEGMAGIPIVLGFKTSPYRVMVQLSGSAMRIRADQLCLAFKTGGQLNNLLLLYTHTLLTQISQSASCNRFHTAEERLCRWLLVSRDRVQSDTLPLTQEFLAHMIGVPRTSVTMIAGALQRSGLISCSRGKIRIVDRPGMESFSCECYRIVREEIVQFLAA